MIDVLYSERSALGPAGPKLGKNLYEISNL